MHYHEPHLLDKRKGLDSTQISHSTRYSDNKSCCYWWFMCHDKTLNQQCILAQARLPMINHLTSYLHIGFPLLMVTYHEHGGYTMDRSEIGVVLMVVGICELIWQVTV